MFTDLGRLLMWLGGCLFVIGLVFTFAGRLPGLGHLPGDIVIEREHFKFYAPLGTMIVLSLLVSLVLNLITRFLR